MLEPDDRLGREDLDEGALVICEWLAPGEGYDAKRASSGNERHAQLVSRAAAVGAVACDALPATVRRGLVGELGGKLRHVEPVGGEQTWKGGVMRLQHVQRALIGASRAYELGESHVRKGFELAFSR